MNRFVLLLAWLTLAIAPAAAAIAGLPLSSTASRGAISASDQIPILPAGAPALQNTTAGAVLGYVRNYPAGIHCDGTDDDTSVIQGAINAGVSFDLPAGVCIFSANLTVSTTASNGQTIRGVGETAGDGSGTGKTVLKPTSAVTSALVIDGAPFGGYIQGFSIEDLTLDMTSMSSGTKGFSQLQAYDIRYTKIRVRNDAGKSSWNFGPGAYTTHLDDVQGALVYCLGNGTNNPTTITLTNPDINGLDVEQCANVTTIGGAIQPSYNPSGTIVYLAPGTSPKGFGANAGGMYVALGSYLLNAQYFTSAGTDWEAGSEPPATCTLGGWSFGTYNDGTHGCLKIVMGIQIGGGVSNVSFIDPTFAGMYLYNLGGSADNLTLTGYQSGGGMGNYNEGAETFDASLYLNNSQALYGYAGDRASGGTQTFLIDASTGSANFNGGLSVGSLAVSGASSVKAFSATAAANGNFLNVYDTGSHGIFGCYSGGTRASSSCFGANFFLYSDDAGTNQTIGLNAINGSFMLKDVTDGGVVQVKNSAGALEFSVSTSATSTSATVYTSGAYSAPGGVGVTCSGAPTASFAASGGIVTHC